MVVESPLAHISTIKEAEAYDHWPSADWYDYSVMEAQCDRVRQNNRIVVFVGDRTNRVAQFKPYMYIRGMENAYLDMAMNPELFEYITFRISSFYLEYLNRILKTAKGKIDIFQTGDDFGGQSSLLCSRDMWRQFLKPGFRKFMEVIRAHKVITMHHTCGFVVPIIDDLIECGLDILNPIQPFLQGMEAEILKKKFGNRIVFHGGISIQKNLPFGSPEAVRQEVRTAIRILAPGGGYIPCTAHNLQADVPVENILALYDAYREFGPYPVG
jgi:uroporphyrinogen decarboxylase